MKLVRTLAAAAAFFSLHAAASAQDAPKPWSSVTFHFERQGLPVSRYTIVLQADGRGTYYEGAPAFDIADVPGAQSIQVGAATLAKLGVALPTVSTGKCETRLKNIAQTGKKTLAFATKDASPSCTFNYSDDEQMNNAVAAFQAVAETMQIGEQLVKLHRFDRLGLDAEMELLVNRLKEGRALEPANIAAALQSIVDDERVIERVRRKAARILQESAGK